MATNPRDDTVSQLIDAINAADNDRISRLLAGNPLEQGILDYGLRLSVGAGNAGAVMALLTAGAKPGDRDFEAVRVAAHLSHAEVLRALLAEGPLPKPSVLGDLLFEAAKKDQADIVQCLLDVDCDPRQNDSYALRLAVQKGSAAAKALIAAGADVNANRGEPLQLAVMGKHLAAVQLLLQAGATVDDALMNWSLPHSTPAITRVLRQAGATAPQPLSLLGRSSAENQCAFMSAGAVIGLDPVNLAGMGVSHAALCLLLQRQGHTELAAMLTATQMLEPMAPDARAEILKDLLAQYRQPGITHAGP